MLVAEYRAQAAGEITVVDLTQPPARLDNTPSPAIIPVTNAPSEEKPDPNKEP